MTNFFLGIIAWVAVVVVLSWIVGNGTTLTHQQAMRMCQNHHGVAQIAYQEALGSTINTQIVCRDGVVKATKAR